MSRCEIPCLLQLVMARSYYCMVLISLLLGDHPGESVTGSFLTTNTTYTGSNSSRFGNSNLYYLRGFDSCSEFCSPWVYCDSGECRCGEIPDEVLQCDLQSNMTLLHTDCLTYNEEKHLSEVGKCVYTSSYNRNSSGLTTLPRSLSELDDFMCGKLFNRTGTLCGKCKDNHYPPAYSFELNCIQCLNGKANWWKYVLVAYLPLTIFFFIVLLFKINAASSSLYPFVLCAQAATMPIIARVELMYLKDQQQTIQTLSRWIIMLYGIWNLDFFRSFDLGICLRTDTLQTLALDLAVGVYPLLLMVITYLVIYLYDHNFRPVVLLWKPFQAVSDFFQSKVEIKTTLIDAFCTFFLLSNTKLLSSSVDLLVPVRVYQLNSVGHITQSRRLYNDANIKYFGHEHLPYAILAIGVLVVFALLPVLLLILYPFRWFQRILNVFPVRWYILHTFVDSLQGYYKNGTEPGTRDCRWFASVFFISRYLLLLIGVSTFSPLYFPLATMVIGVVIILVVAIKPFKPTGHLIHPITMFLILIGLGLLGAFGPSSTNDEHILVLFWGLCFVMAILPLVYVSALAIHWVYSHKRFGLNVIRKLRGKRRGYTVLQ